MIDTKAVRALADEAYSLPHSVRTYLRQCADEIDALENQEIQPDGPCAEADGCPTERAVLQRAWRQHRDEIDALRADNAAMRKENAAQSVDIDTLYTVVNDQRAEIETLRELVREALGRNPPPGWGERAEKALNNADLPR